MICFSCARTTLGLFTRSRVGTDLPILPWPTPSRSCPPPRFFSVTPVRLSEPPRKKPKRVSEDGEMAVASRVKKSTGHSTRQERKDSWMEQKAAVKKMLGGEHWNPRKKLSPDTREGIRHLNKVAPERFTCSALAQHFKVSPEAIRRILKSTWQPSDAEQEDRLRRWDLRGQTIWSNLVELGVKPPKKWREMGVGSAGPGMPPKWKGNTRNRVSVGDSISEELIPIVEKSGERTKAPHIQNTAILERLL